MLRPNPDPPAVPVPAGPALAPHVTVLEEEMGRGRGAEEREVKSYGGRLGGRRRKWCDGWASAGWGGATSAVGGAERETRDFRPGSHARHWQSRERCQGHACGSAFGIRDVTVGGACLPPQALPRNRQVLWLLALGVEQQRIPARGRVVPVVPA